MHKLEPKELSNVPADELAALVGLCRKRSPRQLDLVGSVAA
jgi:adenine-specific DNA-methyltransferase